MQLLRLHSNIAVGSALFLLVVCDASVPASLPLSAPLDSPQPPQSEARSADGGLASQNPHGLDALTLLGGSQESGFSSDEVEDPKPSLQPHYFWDEGGEINGTSLDPDITEGDSPVELRGAAHGDLNSSGPSMAALGGALEPDLWESQGGASGIPDEAVYDPPATDTAPLTPTTASDTGVILRWDEGEDRGAVPRDEEAVLHGGEGGGVTQMTSEEDKGEYSPMEEIEGMETVGSHGKTKGDESALHHGKTEGDESAVDRGEAEGDETAVTYGKTEDESAVHHGEAEGDETAVYYGKTEDESAVHHGKMEGGETVVHRGNTADESAVHHGKTEGDESTVHGKTEGDEFVVYYGKTKGDESAVHHGNTEGDESTVHHGKTEGDGSTVHHGKMEGDESTVHHRNTERDEGAVHHRKTEGDESTVHHGNMDRPKGPVHHGKTEGEKSSVDHGKTDGEAGGWVHHTPLTTVPSSSSPSSSSLPRTTATDAPLHRPDPPFPPQSREPKLRRGSNEHSSDNDFPEKHPSHDSLQVICEDWNDLKGKGYVILNMSENSDCEEFRVDSGYQLLEMLETAFSGKMSSPQGSWLISLSKPIGQDHQLLMTLTNDQGVIATKDVLSMLGEIKRGLHDIGIQNYSSVSSCQARPSQSRSDYGKLFVVLVIIGSVCVVIIASGLVYICWQRRLPKIKNTSRGEELHFVENGCHDNPTLDVASDSQSEMQEKKHSANGVAAGGGGGGGSRGSGWQVVVNEPGKEEAENMEEDTHL